MSPRTLAALVFVTATLAGAAAPAQTTNAAQSPWTAAIEFGPAWHHDPSYQTFLSGRSVPPNAGLSFGRDLARLGSRLTLGAELGWRIENTQGRVRQAFDTMLFTNQAQGSVTLRLEVLSWLTPYARLAGGASYLDATVKTDDGATLTGGAWAPFGSAGAGVLITGGRWFDGAGAHTLRLAVSIEGGYQLVAPTTLQAARPEPDDERTADDRVASQAASLGTVDASAAYLRFTVGLRF